MVSNGKRQHPDWLKVRIPHGAEYQRTRAVLCSLDLHTVCEEALCPNLGECFSNGTATFMILGNTCTRACGFCAVNHGHPDPPDTSEPERVAMAVERMALRHAVVTSVTRDDLPDGGAAHFAATAQRIREHTPTCTVEVLIPDLKGSAGALETVLGAKPDVLNHNVETVRRLQKTVRPQATYELSLWVLRHGKEVAPAITTKSGLMLGLGEKWDEVLETLGDLRAAGCEAVTMGQYLRPTRQHLPIARHYTPEEFTRLGKIASDMGFRVVESAPLVRSSYRADRAVRRVRAETRKEGTVLQD